MADIPLLLLAAGGSSRMGQAKALLPWGEHTLIEHQIRTLLKTGRPVVVVLGSHRDLIKPVIEKLMVTIVINENWADGMGSSIAVGVSHLASAYPDADGLLITVLDQPMLTEAHFEQLCRTFQPGLKEIIVSRSASGWQGVPVVFDRHYFGPLLSLKGDEGAKKVIRRSNQAVKVVECGELMEDLDTPEAYRRLQDRMNDHP
jgi:molybdenum cofactor cytidylyltransferase